MKRYYREKQPEVEVSVIGWLFNFRLFTVIIVVNEHQHQQVLNWSV